MPQALRMVAIGDSIVWGQGNLDNRKFVSLVAASFQQRGVDVTPASLAHSGALVAPTQTDASPAIWGEVPEPAPSIFAQLRAIPAPESVDVLILNGGINDVSPFSIVVANPFDADGVADLTTHVTRVFGGPVQQLIDAAVTRCPTATVVVCGYYPIISEDTNVRALVRLMKHLPRPRGVANFLDTTAEHLTDDLLEIVIKCERRRMIEQSQAFADLSKALLSAAVAGYPGRAFFADPAFGPENAFAASKTWLWSGADDPLAAERLKRYAEHLPHDPFDWPIVTPLASMCHPNELGSAQYAQAIEACLAEAGRLT
jgi:lysophospholipase L1-like esterase